MKCLEKDRLRYEMANGRRRMSSATTTSRSTPDRPAALTVCGNSFGETEAFGGLGYGCRC
jgi:hypothetical protein